MPRKDFDLDGYFEELFKDASLPPEQVEAAKAALKAEAVANKLADGVLRQRDYSRQTQELAAQRNELNTFYMDLVTTYNQSEADKVAALARAQSYEQLYGPLDAQSGANGHNGTPMDTSKFLTKDTYEKELATLRDQSLAIMTQLGSLPSKHAREFNEDLDVDALMAESLKRQMPPKLVYEDMVRDRRDEARAKDIAAQKKAAYEEGFKAAATQQRTPSAAFPSQVHPLDAREALGDKLPAGPAWKRAVDKLAAGGYDKEAAVPD